MIYVLTLLAMLLPSLAFGQSMPAGSTQMQVLSTTNDMATLGGGFDYATHYDARGYIDQARFVCTAACYIAISPTGQTPHASAATGIYLPAGVPAEFRVPRFANVAAVRVSGDGILIVTGMTK